MKNTVSEAARVPLTRRKRRKLFLAFWRNAPLGDITMPFPTCAPQKPAISTKPMWKPLATPFPIPLPGILCGRFPRQLWKRMRRAILPSTDRRSWFLLSTNPPTTWWFRCWDKRRRDIPPKKGRFCCLTTPQRAFWKP